jgi:hypothetical protein
MKTIKFATKILFINFIFFLVYNTYFGWNWKPINDSEKWCDDIFHYINIFGLILYAIPITRIYEYYLNKIEEQSEN